MRSRNYHDDRLFIMDLRPAVQEGKEVWVLVTQGNVPGFPTMRVDRFKTRDEAVAYLREIEPATPRASLGGASPSPTPTYEEHLAWCEQLGIPSCMDIHEMRSRRQRPELIVEEVSAADIAALERRMAVQREDSDE
jgi:hypothetical protein